jgi:hypothetical protein
VIEEPDAHPPARLVRLEPRHLLPAKWCLAWWSRRKT